MKHRQWLALARQHLICCCLLTSPAAICQDESLVVIVNQTLILDSINKKQLKHIYIGSKAYDIIPANLNSNNRLRTIFNTRVLGLTESRIRSFWVQMKFTGRGKPPLELETPEAAIAFVKTTPNGMAYVDANTILPSDVKVIFSLN